MYKKSKRIAIVLAFSLLTSFVPAINASAINSTSQLSAKISEKVITPQLDTITVKEGYVKIAYTNEDKSK